MTTEEQKQKNREKSARWRKRHPDRARAAWEKYAAANPGRSTAHYRASPERGRASASRWRKANPDYVRPDTRQAAQWGKENPERVRLFKVQSEARRRARKCGTEVVDCPRVAAKYFIAAWLRSMGDDVHVDHIIPLSRGGTHTADNLQILPAVDNLRKGTKV